MVEAAPEQRTSTEPYEALLDGVVGRTECERQLEDQRRNGEDSVE
jgi:hypothetical protein